MPDNNHREQAVEAIAKRLAEGYRGTVWDSPSSAYWLQEAKSLLALRDPSGLPWVVVLAPDQMMSVQGAIPARDAQEVMAQLWDKGFRRVVLPKENGG